MSYVTVALCAKEEEVGQAEALLALLVMRVGEY
jgi:hypothetical protein